MGRHQRASVVDLTPTWYVKYENNWFNYQELMAKLTETGSLIGFQANRMDFSSVFGVECLLFNIYSEARSEQQNVLQSNQTIPIEQRLASEDIKYSGELSDEYLSGYYLSGEQTDLAAALREAQGETIN